MTKHIDDEILREVDALAPEAPLARDDVRYLPADLMTKRRVDVAAKKRELEVLVDRRFWMLDAAYGWRLAGFLTVAAGLVIPFMPELARIVARRVPRPTLPEEEAPSVGTAPIPEDK